MKFKSKFEFITSFMLNTLAAAKAGIDKQKEILDESTLSNFKNPEIVILYEGFNQESMKSGPGQLEPRNR